jgi:hypothetical protein
MADININKFRTSVVREGSRPASAGFVESEGQDPVDPAGSTQNHLPVTIAPAADGLSITDSQVLGGAGTTAQYLRGDGSLATFPALTGFVPYTGATADVNLGTHDLTAERGTFENNGSSDTLTVNHTSGSGKGINVSKGGNGEALLVTKTSGSGNAMSVVGGRTSLVDLSLSSVSNATGNFLTISGGVVHQRTPSETRSDVGAQAQLNGTGFVKASGTTITYDNSTYQVTSEKAQPNGYASLDSNGKVPLVQINDALIGNVNFQGLWNAATNTPTLANPPASGTKGYYYIVSTAGTFAGISFEVGDWIISNGTAWGKVDNTDAVSSVFGRTGNVTASNGDYNTSQVTENTNLYFTNARAIASVLTGYTSGAGTISAADSILSAIQKLNGNIGALVTGVSSVNGQTGVVVLTTTNIAEGTNLYYTEARVNSNTNVAANTAARHAAVTLGTANGLSLNVQQLSLGLASAGVTGALSGTDWSTFNSKVSSQWITSGSNIYYNTGNVTIGGTSPTERLSVQGNTNLGNSIAGSAFTTRISGFAVNETESVRYGNYGFLILNSDSGYTASARRFVITNAFNTNKFAIIRSVDANTDPALGNQGFVSSGTPDFVISSAGNVGINNPNPTVPLDVLGLASFSSSVTASSFIRNGGTSSQFLKADGSVDSNAYITGNQTITLSGDATGSGTTAITVVLANSGVAAGTYNNSATQVRPFTVDAKGRITSIGTAVTITPAFSDVTSKPTTLAGYGITDAYTQAQVNTLLNGKQNALNGTGFVKISGTTISYDNSTYLTTAAAASTYVTLDTAQTIIGEKTFRNSIILKNQAAGLNGLVLSSFSPDRLQIGGVTYFSEIIFAATSRSYTLPDASGTIALVGGSGVGTVTSVAALTLGTTGTDLSSSVANGTTTPVITLNVPTASAANRGALSAADWTTFNGKENAITAGTTAQYYRGDKTFQTLNTAAVPELTNLYYTEARVSANTDVAANTAARHNAVTLGTANGLSLSTQQLSLGLASSSANGALSSTDWTTFNNKQNALTNPVTGTGTSGQVAYFNGTSSITGESNLFWDATNDRLGIGTAIPSFKLDIQSTIDASFLQVTSSATANNSSLRIGIDGNNAFINASGGSTGILQLRTYGSTKATLDVSGNLGLGVTPSAWGSGQTAFQFGARGGLSADGSTTYVDNNRFFNGTSNIYTQTAAASIYAQGGGVHLWYTAPSGTAGNAISFTQAMTLGTNSGLSIGTPSAAPSQGLLVQGNVGVGTSPSSKFHVLGGDITFQANTSNANLVLKGSSTNESTIYFLTDSTFKWNIGTSNNDLTFFKFQGGASESMRITSGGNVLINQTGDDGYKLSVNGVSRSKGEAILGDFSNLTDFGQAGMYATNSSFADGFGSLVLSSRADAARPIIFTTSNGTSATERMRITSGGNVLIGTTSATTANANASILFGDTDSGIIYLTRQTGTDQLRFYTGGNRLGYVNTASNILTLGTANFPLALFTNDTERMRIFSDGNVFIGSSPSNSGARLQVNGGDLRVQGNTNLGNSLGSTLSSTFTTRVSGFALRQDVSNRYGNYGVLILNSDSGWTSSARRFMITNGIGANKFGIIRSVDANTDPALGDAGSIASGTVDFEINNAGAATFSSSVTAASIIRSGGTSSQYLMADGSVSTLTNPVTGTGSGTTNTIPKFTGANALGNSIITDSGSLVSIDGNFRIRNSNGFNDSVNFDRTAINGLILNSSGNLILNGSTGSSRITCYGDGYFSGGVQTGLTTGASSSSIWLLGQARGGTVTTNATVRVEIGGVLVDLVARYV